MTFRAVSKQKAVSDDGIEVYNVDRFTKRYVADGRTLDLHRSAYKDKMGEFGTFLLIPKNLVWSDGQSLTSAEREVVINNVKAAMEALGTRFRILERGDGDISD